MRQCKFHRIGRYAFSCSQTNSFPFYYPSDHQGICCIAHINLWHSNRLKTSRNDASDEVKVASFQTSLNNNLYPIPRTFTILIRSSFANLWRSLVMNTCRLRELKKLSSPQSSRRMLWVLTTSFRCSHSRRRISDSRCESSCEMPA